jgi:DNA-binding transcriptional MerR regulator
MKKFYSIKDLGIEAGVSYHTVYYYIQKGLIEEVEIMGEDQRVFDEECLARLRKIVNLRVLGKSVNEIQKLLDKEG